MTAPHVLGLDIGTSSVKALIVDETGQPRAESRAPLSPSHPRPGWSEQPPHDWWRATRAALVTLRKEHGDSLSLCGAVGLSGQMHGAVLLDAAHRPTRPAILWNDGRAAELCETVTASIGFDRLLEIAANRAYAGFTAPKIRWLRDHEPRSLDSVAHLLSPKDYVALHLTGAVSTDVSDASGTLLLDVGARRWNEELAAAWSVDPDWLPEVHESATVIGTVRRAGELTDLLPHGVPVVAGAGDQAAAAVGLGVVRPGRTSVCIGTSGVVFSQTDGLLRDPEGIAHAFGHAVPNAWHLMGVMLSSGGALDWFAREATPARTFEAITAGAARSTAGANGVTFLPYLAGERCPFPDASARATLNGMHLGTTADDLARAVIEGIVGGLAACAAHLEKLGLNISDVAVTGGGAKSTFILELLASAIDRAVEVAPIDEGSAYGAALLAATAIDGAPVSDWSDRWRRAGRVISPNAALTAPMRDVIARQRDLYERLRR